MPLQLSSGDQSKDLYKLIHKPSMFSPETRDQEVSQWRDWLSTVRQYSASVDLKYKAGIDLIPKDPSVPVDFDTLDPEKQRRSLFLYSFLSSLPKGRSLTILRNVGDNHGFEALRNLVQTFQPSSNSRALAILNAIMS